MSLFSKEVVVYIPKYDALVIFRESPPDPIEIGFVMDADIESMRKIYFEGKHNNVDEVSQNEVIEFIGFL